MTLPVLALAAYLVAVLAIGFAWRRRAGRDEASFFLADRSLGTFWGSVGLASLTTGGSTTVALAALVYTHGLPGLWLDLSGALGLAALGLFLARRVRREGAMTLPEIIGRHYGTSARRVAALLVLASEVVWFALLTEATQVVLTAALGMAPTGAIVLATAVFVAYTALGGQFAVVRTDLLQYGLMLVGIPGVALVCALRGAGGLSGLPASSGASRPRRASAPRTSSRCSFSIGLPHLVGSDVYLKLLSCRDEATARRSALLAAGSKVLFGLAVAAIALAARKALPPLQGDAAQPCRRRSSASRRRPSPPSSSWPSSRRCRPPPTSCCSPRRPSPRGTSLPRFSAARWGFRPRACWRRCTERSASRRRSPSTATSSRR